MQDLVLAQVAKFGGAANFSCGGAAITGLLSHWLYFINGPKSMDAAGIVVFHAIALSMLLARTVLSYGFYDGLVVYAAISGSYFAALYTSIGVYRIFFHPLRKFPGPFPARITKFYSMWANRDWKLHDRILKLHEKLGDVVRLGPNEISVSDIDTYIKFHGPQSKVTKRWTGFYGALASKHELNLDAIWENEAHRDRRRVWDTALGTKALERYEEETRAVLRAWLGRIEEVEGKPIDTALYAKLIPFDNMGRVGFSHNFGTVQDGRDDRMLELIETSFKLAARMGGISWPLMLLSSIPRFGMVKEFEGLGARLVDERMATDSEQSHDMMKYFLDDYKSEKPKSFRNINVLYSDSLAILIGATDTISCALGYSFYFLAKDPKLRQRLYDEIAPVHSKTVPGEFAVADLAKIEYLDAFINETLRMHPPAATNGPRVVPPEGVTLADGTYITGGVTVFTPLHVYQRSSKYWKQPHEFIPERWTTRPDLIIDRRAFVPFHYGRFDCVGKRLAMNVIRMTVAYTLWNYDFEVAPGEDAERLHRESKFQLIVKPGSLNCVFKKRPEAGSS
ncbi:Cytochrome P450 monooxygenase FCK2 [Colletotrichum tropicale]|nr:Cytochrome P450 monooxygenase FCK2 [Colletotrichum tropicale]